MDSIFQRFTPERKKIMGYYQFFSLKLMLSFKWKIPTRLFSSISNSWFSSFRNAETYISTVFMFALMGTFT